MLHLKNGMIYDAISPQPFAGDILIDAGRIRGIGTGLDIPSGCETLDVKGLSIYPGFIDAHSHIGLSGTAIGYEGQDYNEYNDPVTPHLRAIDGINPLDPSLRDALKGGVTCVTTGPGSSNAIGGTFTAIKTHGARIDKMIVRAETAMKCAFGENPKRVYKDKTITSRMTNAALIRGALAAARLYGQKKAAAGDDVLKMPAYDMKSEALLPVLDGTLPLKAHAHQANDLFTALRIAKEFSLRITLEHVTEGHLIADELVEEGVMLAVGPTLGVASKFELQHKQWITPGMLAKAGCHVSIITDAPVIPQEYLPLCAGLAVKAGMDPFAALQAITINPAQHIGIADRVGSLECGKDADLVITDGSPFAIESNVRYVFCNGELVHSA